MIIYKWLYQKALERFENLLLPVEQNAAFTTNSVENFFGQEKAVYTAEDLLYASGK